MILSGSIKHIHHYHASPAVQGQRHLPAVGALLYGNATACFLLSAAVKLITGYWSAGLCGREYYTSGRFPCDRRALYCYILRSREEYKLKFAYKLRTIL
jgi:hypothetical protein